MSDTVRLTSFPGTDPLSQFRAAAAFLRQHPGTTLVVPPGLYRLDDPEAVALQEAVMRGEFGPQPQGALFNPERRYAVGVDLSGCRDVTIEGAGATFFFNGFLEPFRLENTFRVTLRGFTLDYERRPYSKGKILAASQEEMTVDFAGETLISPAMPLLRAVAADGDGHWRHAVTGLPAGISAEPLGGNALKIKGFGWPGSEGLTFFVTHSYHFRPAIHLFHAEETLLDGITIHSHHGMGVVGFQSRGIRLVNCAVTPAPGEALSTNTDATHFASCRGEVVISGCRFDHQGDDAANVHNYYHTIRAAEGCCCRLTLDAPTGTHSQEIDLFAPGDRLELTDPDTLAVLGSYTVRSHQAVTTHESILEVERPLPPDVAGKLFSDSDLLPGFTFSHNTVSEHFARGVLVKCRRVRVTDNSFTGCCGTAVHVAAEAQWSEGAGSADVLIARNHITHCGRQAPYLYGLQRDTGGIVVNAAAKDPHALIHHGVVIAENVVDCPGTEHAVYAGNTEGLTIRGNRLTCQGEPLVVKDCRGVTIEETGESISKISDGVI